MPESSARAGAARAIPARVAGPDAPPPPPPYTAIVEAVVLTPPPPRTPQPPPQLASEDLVTATRQAVLDTPEPTPATMRALVSRLVEIRDGAWFDLWSRVRIQQLGRALRAAEADAPHLLVGIPYFVIRQTSLRLDALSDTELGLLFARWRLDAQRLLRVSEFDLAPERARRPVVGDAGDVRPPRRGARTTSGEDAAPIPKAATKRATKRATKAATTTTTTAKTPNGAARRSAGPARPARA